MPATKPNVMALVEQMPETDRDLQIKGDQAKAGTQAEGSDPSKSANRLGVASKFTGPDPVKAGKIFAEILSGGKESIAELVALCRDPSDPEYKNYKPVYVLHGLVIYVGRPGEEANHRLLAQTLTAEVGNAKHSKGVRGQLIRELEWIGGKEAVDAVGQQLLDNELHSDAARTLLALGEDVIPQFRNALPKSTGASRKSILHALGSLQDASSLPELRKALTDPDRQVRHTAAWALANIGDAEFTDELLKLTTAAEGGERTENIKLCFLLAGKLAAAGQKPQAKRIYEHLRKESPERHIRDAADSALTRVNP